jgi:uncharacterized C2H2 Zn-finger protein
MGKHVCPACEDVYALRMRTDITLPSVDLPLPQPLQLEAWQCPACDFIFHGQDDVVKALTRISEAWGQHAPQVENTLLQEKKTRVRFGSGLLQKLYNDQT